MYIIFHIHGTLIPWRSTPDLCTNMNLVSNAFVFFQTFFIFWPSFPSLRDLQSRLKIELFENGRLADFYCWHIWMLHLHLVEPHLTIVNLCINQGLDFYCANFVASSGGDLLRSVLHIKNGVGIKYHCYIEYLG